MPSEGENVVSSRAAFPSTVYPWTRVSQSTGVEIRLAPYDENHYTDPEDILSLIDENTAVVVISHVEYANGQRYDLARFSEAAICRCHADGRCDPIHGNGPYTRPRFRCRRHSRLWLQVAQGDLRGAVGYLSPRAKKLVPGMVGFRSHEDIWDMKSDRMDLPEDASRFEFTTLHFGALQGLAKSIEEMLEIGQDEIWAHDMKLADAVIEGAMSMGLEVVSPIDPEQRSAIVSIRTPRGEDSSQIVRRLQDEFGILVTDRSGMIRSLPTSTMIHIRSRCYSGHLGPFSVKPPVRT